MPTFFYFVLLLLPTSVLNVRASFYLSYRVGAISLFAWLLPGVLAINGITFDVTPLGPDKFQFGEGFTGGIECAAVNLAIFLILGWSLVLLAGSLWSRDRVKHIYDHIWYPLGLVAALYFVTDVSLKSYEEDFQTTDEKFARYLALYADSVRNVKAACKQSPLVSSEAAALCQFSNQLQWQIQAALESHPTVRARMSSPDWPRALINDPELAKSIDLVNSWGCDQQNLDSGCFKVPIDMALAMNDIDRRYLFLPKSYADAVEKYHQSLAETDKKVTSIKRSFNIRYFVFLGVAFLAGGKLANASRALLAVDKTKPRSWVAWCVRRLLSLLVKTLNVTFSLVKRLIDFCRRYPQKS
ncbi:MAG: hypothetical protein ABI167_10260 [Nitrosospira sp.]